MPSYIKGKKIELQILKLGRLTGWFVRRQKRGIDQWIAEETGGDATRSKWLAFRKLASFEKDGKYTEDTDNSNWGEDKSLNCPQRVGRCGKKS